MQALATKAVERKGAKPLPVGRSPICVPSVLLSARFRTTEGPARAQITRGTTPKARIFTTKHKICPRFPIGTRAVFFDFFSFLWYNLGRKERGGNNIELESLGIPKKKIEQLKSAGIEDVEALVRYYPRKYLNLQKRVCIRDFKNFLGEIVAFTGVITNLKRGVGFVTATVQDPNKDSTTITWFGQMYLMNTLQIGVEYIFCGKITQSKPIFPPMMSMPEFFSCDPRDFNKILPIYKKIPGMSYEYILKCANKAAELMLFSSELEENLPDAVIDMTQTLGIRDYVRILHSPDTENDIELIRRRQLADDLYPFAYKMTERKLQDRTDSPFAARSADKLGEFVNTLPFTLTVDQRSTIGRIWKIARDGKRVNMLIQGDVGCGKTAIAMMAAVMMAENGYQTAVMAPTTVLAEQHYREFSEKLGKIGIKTALLISGTKKSERDGILANIADGSVQVVVGTHAVISDDVIFDKLGMTIVDEEHRFGVEHRDRLRKKANEGVHSLSMTATPIPRTLAVTLYGENTEVASIRTMPGGRKPIITATCSDYEKTYAAMLRQIHDGHQCYVVCPLIEDSEADAMAGVKSVDAVFKEIKEWFEKHDSSVRIDRITGDLAATTIRQRINDFAKGKTQVLVSTTIVEVGVNVPNATVMVISNAERFGLAQLHQLRGRVGRGDYQSYCVLLTSKKTPRISAMLETADGFEISRRDLELRGSGDIVGTKQHGVDKYVDLMLRYPNLYREYCRYAETKISE